MRVQRYEINENNNEKQHVFLILMDDFVVFRSVKGGLGALLQCQMNTLTLAYRCTRSKTLRCDAPHTGHMYA